MAHRIPTAGLVPRLAWLILTSSASAQSKSPAPARAYSTPRASWGDPDLQGIWPSGGRITCFLCVGAFLCVAAAGGVLSPPWMGAAVRTAAPTRIVFVARVGNIYDPGEALGDAIQVDDLLRGTITFDADAADTDPRPDVGRYEHHQPPYGISIEAGPFIFQTDPARVDFSIVISNDHGVPPRDSYVMTSAVNLPLLNGAAVSRISWELVDDSLKALETTRLTGSPPDLEKWQSEFGLTVQGQSTVEFIIRAHVVEAKLCTAGTRCPSPQ